MSIRIRFVTDDDVVSAGIRVAEYGFWASHCESVMPNGSLLGAHFDGGVQTRPSNYDATKWVKQLFVDVPSFGTQEQDFYDFLNHQLGKPYDIGGIAGFVSQRDWRLPNAWFCSELMAAALEESALMTPVATEVYHITPRDLLLILSSRYPVGPVLTQSPAVIT
jgi:hypothetical protein